MKVFGMALVVGVLTVVIWSTINLAFGDPPDQALRLAFHGAWGTAIGFIFGVWAYRTELLP